MSDPGKHAKALAIVLLLVQFCLPLFGPVYVSDYLSTREASHTGIICAHPDADAGHESQDGHKLITHCHELDAPCDTSSGPLLEHLPLISHLASSYKGALLPGYAAPIHIPPKNPFV